MTLQNSTTTEQIVVSNSINGNKKLKNMKNILSKYIKYCIPKFLIKRNSCYFTRKDSIESIKVNNLVTTKVLKKKRSKILYI